MPQSIKAVTTCQKSLFHLKFQGEGDQTKAGRSPTA